MKTLNTLRRRLISTLVAGLALPALAVADTSNFPDQPVQLVVGFSAGGPADTVARTLSQRLGELLNTSIVIVNRPGADGVIAAGSVARARPDGHTLLLAPSTQAINDSLYKDLSYDTRKDFIPVSFIGESPNIIGVHPSVPVNSLAELAAHSKKPDTALFYGSTSSVTLLATEMFNVQTGAEMERVPYKGAGQAIPALLSGEVQVMVSSVLTLLPHVESGRVRGLAVTSRSRLPIAPDIATATEQGLSNYSASTWYGLFAPADTPEPIVEKLAQIMSEAMKDEQVQATFNKQGMITHSDIDSPAVFRDFFEDEIVKWKEAVEASGAPTN